MSKKRFLAILLSIVMLFQAMPMQMLAEGIALFSNVVEGETYYEVKFVVRGTEGESVAATQYVLDGNGLSFPQNPAKSGYAFVGWFASENVDADGTVIGGASPIENGTTVSADVTYVAGFIPIETYTVTIEYLYRDEDGNVSSVADKVIRSYTSADEPETIKSPTSAKIGEGFELVYPEDTEITINPAELTQDKTIPVYYYLPNAKYSVNHYALPNNEGGENELLFTQELEGRAGAHIKPSEMNETVYSDAKHYIYDSASGEITLKAGEDPANVINVYYTRRNYTLSYNSQGGSYVAPQTVPYGKDVTVYSTTTNEIPGETTTSLTCGLPIHTHTRNGWNSCYDWRGNLNCGYVEHTAHVDSCYETVTGDPTYETVVAGAPTREGFEFTGWYLDAACTQKADATMTLTGNVTVYAGWKSNTVSYTIVYMKEVWGSGEWNGNSYDTPLDAYVYDSSETASATVGEIGRAHV